MIEVRFAISCGCVMTVSTGDPEFSMRYCTPGCEFGEYVLALAREKRMAIDDALIESWLGEKA